jgi:cysteine desulfurase
MIRDDTILVSVCSVDSEIGIRQPIEKIASIIKEYPNCYFHTDATQAIGKVMIDYSLVDLITITPHKFYGLSGIGILIKRSNISITAQIDGGKSITIYRSGTPTLALIVSSAKALKLAYDEEKSSYDYILKLNNIIKNGLVKYKRVHINSTANSINNIINFSVKGIRAIDLERRLESYSIYVSTKTSCCPIETPSKLVYALTRDKSLSSSSIRLSISSFTTLDDVLEFLRVFDIIYKEYDSNGEI